jgi:chromosome segregation ATPase
VQITRLEIAGFKSFGGRKAFDFKPGITAIVGPNGSGKSNVADAIRWVLGEQKSKRLRVAKSEDVVFHGTEKKPQASMAEVSVVFDNTLGKFPLELSEIQISRHLLRSGESQYRLNGRRAKLSQIEELLAKTGFGVESYTVVGQGMIDQLLTATGSQRKMLFDEASGIRQFDIRRGEARRNLKASSANLERVKDILKELEPASEALALQTASIATLKPLKLKLDSFRKEYLTKEMYILSEAVDKTSQEIAQYQKKLSQVKLDLKKLHSSSSNIRKEQSTHPAQAEKLKGLELERDSLAQAQLLLQTELGVLESRLQGFLPSKTELAELSSKKSMLIVQIKRLTDKHQSHSVKTSQIEIEIAALNSQLGILTTQLEGMRAQLHKSQKKEFVNHALGLVQLVRTQLRQTNTRKEIDSSMQKLSQMLEMALQDNAAELAVDIVKVQNQISKYMGSREDIVDVQTQEVIGLRSIELDIASHQKQLDDIESQDLGKPNKESSTISKDIITHNKKIDILQNQIKAIDKQISDHREKLYSDSSITAQQAQQVNITSDVEALASEKARLELSIEVSEEKLGLLNANRLNLKNQSINWFGPIRFISGKNIKSSVSLEKITKLEFEIAAIEDIDPSLIAEAKDSASRVEFLKTQERDLGVAIDDTESLIASLEKDIKKRFEASFKKINSAFNKYFVELFSGGSAELKLVAQQDGEYGIDILVSPAGKRGKSINALSGGEKALSAVALLAAILSSNPSPFIVLDEVDAALDDENSTRFCKVLKRLSAHSQVIIITHNQETMQSAANIFGVTTGQKGDSEILQLALQQASGMAQS